MTAPTDFRMFPILWGYDVKGAIEKLRASGVPYMPVCMPWEMLAPHAKQAQSNHGQTLERLAERGGLGPAEALAVLDDRHWDRIPIEKASHELCQRIAAWVNHEIAHETTEPQVRAAALGLLGGRP